MSKIYRLDTSSWTVERIIFLVAGVFVSASILLSFWVNKHLIYFTLFVGLMLGNFSLTGYCPIAILAGYIKRKNRRIGG